MKRRMLIIALIAVVLTVFQIAMEGGKTQDYSNMEVLENSDHVLVLRPLEADRGLNPDLEYTISKSSIVGRNIPYMVPGYHVRMVYKDDNTRDSTIDYVYQLYILDSDGEVITRDRVPVALSFDKEDFSGVDLIKLTDLHTGNTRTIIDGEDIREITGFIHQVSGINGVSGKGYYEGSYGIAMYDSSISTNNAVFNLTFGDSDSFYFGLHADGYSVHYDLEGIGISEVTRFFSQFG